MIYKKSIVLQSLCMIHSTHFINVECSKKKKFVINLVTLQETVSIEVEV